MISAVRGNGMKDDVISRKAAIDALGERPMVWDNGDDYSLGERNQYDMNKLAIETVPAVDAVPVVRCKDCAHNNLPPTAGNALCSIYYGMTEGYGFCHKGERREE